MPEEIMNGKEINASNEILILATGNTLATLFDSAKDILVSYARVFPLPARNQFSRSLVDGLDFLNSFRPSIQDSQLSSDLDILVQSLEALIGVGNGIRSFILLTKEEPDNESYGSNIKDNSFKDVFEDGYMNVSQSLPEWYERSDYQYLLKSAFKEMRIVIKTTISIYDRLHELRKLFGMDEKDAYEDKVRKDISSINELMELGFPAYLAKYSSPE